MVPLLLDEERLLSESIFLNRRMRRTYLAYYCSLNTILTLSKRLDPTGVMVPMNTVFLFSQTALNFRSSKRNQFPASATGETEIDLQLAA